MKFSDRSTVPPSATAAAAAAAATRRRAGLPVFDLTVGEPRVPIDASILPIVERKIAENGTPYPPIAGLLELRKMAAEWQNLRSGSAFSIDESFVSCGGKFAIFLLLQALLEPRDEVIVVAPFWVSYPPMVALCGATPKIVAAKPENGWRISSAEIEAAITPKTRVILWNNGTNPTGALADAKTVEAIADLAVRHDLFVISDEVYSGLSYDAPFVSMGQFSAARDRVAIVESISKNFAMTGWRVGFSFAPAELTRRMIAMQGQMITGTSIVSQYAALAALADAEKITEKIRSEMRARRDLFVNAWNATIGKRSPILAPPCALYTLLPLSAFDVAGDNDTEFCASMLQKTGVAMTPGTAFGAAGFVRCAFGAQRDEISAAIDALSHFDFSAL